jgi:hypothetical protein
MTRAKRRYLLALVERRVCRKCNTHPDYLPGRCWGCYQREVLGGKTLMQLARRTR